MVSTDSEEKANEDQSVKESEQAEVQYLTESLEALQKENVALKHELLKSKRAPTARLAIVILVVGAATLAVSVWRTEPVLAFIGLGLVFWGILFLFSRPVKFVRSAVLGSAAISSYATIDRMTRDLNCRGRPIYVPPYPKESYLPEYLKGLKEMVVFVPAEQSISIPTIDEMARKEFLVRNPRGICIASPGSGLVDLIERELRSDLSQMDKERFFSLLPDTIVNLELARKLEVSEESNLYHVRMIDSVYKGLYSTEQGLSSVHSVGCPVVSALAGALAKVTGKPVAILKDAVSTDLRIIEVWYQILEI